MKYILSIIIIAFMLSSCSNEKKQSVEDIISTNNLEKIRAKKNQLDEQQQLISSEIKLLDAKIKTLDPQEKIPLVTSFITKEAVFTHYVELQGNVSTKQNLIIYPEFAGVLTNVYVKEGQLVSKGQLLAKIDDGGLSQQLAQMQIQVDLAKTTFERQERLWNQNIGSELQYLQAKSSYQAQARAVEQLKEQIEKTMVRAPFSGTVDDVITDQGSVVAPGQSQLFRVVNLKDMFIKTDVPERYISNVTVGKNVIVEFPILGKSFESKVRQAGNFINPANRTFKIEVTVPNYDSNIKPNLTAKLKINDYINEKAILIPQSIISENAEGEQYVYIITNKVGNKAQAKQIIVETGKTQGDFIEILSGLEHDNEVINEGARSVKDGQYIKILEVENNS
jgi:membrane fusion protein (multidrug efflux system)